MPTKMTTSEQHRAWHLHMWEPVQQCCWCVQTQDHEAALRRARDEAYEKAEQACDRVIAEKPRRDGRAAKEFRIRDAIRALRDEEVTP